RLEAGRIPVSAVEPDSYLARHLERSENIAGTAGIVVGGRVADALEVVEEIGNVARKDRTQFQRAQCVVEACRTRRQQRMPGGNVLGQKLGKLPQLDQGAG